MQLGERRNARTNTTVTSAHVTSGLSVLAKSTRLHKVSFRYGIPIDPSFRSWEDNHRTPRGIIHTISVKGGTDKLSETKSNTVSAIVVLKTMHASSLGVFRLLLLTAPFCCADLSVKDGFG